MTCSTTRLRTSECSAIPTQPPHARTPPHVARRRSRARTAYAPRTHRARRLATRIAKLKIWRHKSLRSLELAAEELNGPPADACLAAVQFDYQANEVQREHPKVKVQGVRHAPGRPARVRLQHLDLLHRVQRRCRVPEPCGRSGGGVTAAAPGFVMLALEFACCPLVDEC